MTQKEKAKAYDEAIDIAQKVLKTIGNATLGNLVLKNEFEKMFPELKKSEHERITKWIKKELESKYVVDNTVNDVMADKALAWLEKQGEQKLDTDFSDLRTWKYIVDAVWTEKEGIGQYLDSPFTEEVAKKLQKRFGNIEPKPSWSEEDERMIDTIISDLERHGGKENSCYSAEINYLKSLKDIAQPKQEWSEEDESRMGNMCHFLEEYGNQYYGHLTLQGTISWLKSLKDRVQPQPKQEWSEEDEKEVAVLEAYIRSKDWSERHVDRALGIVDELVNKVKSLSSQNNITDEELAQAKKDAYNDALDKIEYHSGEPTFDDGWSAAIWYLKKRITMPQNQWKPSEGQLECLGYAIEKAEKDWSPLINNRIYLTLKALKEQLEKL